ncbi:glycosyltransferase family 4 protein [Halobacillus sp. A5]|uniref:glycosyltransferase family 4 protein n=1 Tax=Halobacillus sp. A5 TaxID=2880263 RepID=UPI0020A65116|nr:glycosyltransferase family 4 protein [Halobacillus sp. A5]MCP3028079.1 glycosyltransferase family 4 protein [Halobacillus sp. A5]
MKILITTIFDFPHEGGLSTHITTLKKGLEEDGHSVDVLSFSDVPNWKRKLLAQGPGFIINKVKHGKGQLYNDLQRKKLLASMIQERAEAYDVINSQDIFATHAALESPLPVTATIHGYYTYEAISRGAVNPKTCEAEEMMGLECQAYSGAQMNITVDKRICDYLKETSGTQAHIIRNFIDTEQFNKFPQSGQTRQKHALPEDGYMLFVPRRLTEKNGVMYPLLALREIITTHPEVILVYAGTGEQLGTLKNKTKELKLEDNVYFLGSVAHEDMVELYQSSQIVLIPSVHSHGVEEATSISAIEAMGSGTPVIAGKIGGLKELITHETDGLLFSDRDTSELARQITYLIENPEIANALARHAKQKVTTYFSHTTASKKFIQLYTQAIEKKSLPSSS